LFDILIFVFECNRNDAKDGTWQAPIIDNPICQKAPGCGPWKAPLAPNPAYRGPWSPPMIKNPNYRVYSINYLSF